VRVFSCGPCLRLHIHVDYRIGRRKGLV